MELLTVLETENTMISDRGNAQISCLTNFLFLKFCSSLPISVASVASVPCTFYLNFFSMLVKDHISSTLFFFQCEGGKLECCTYKRSALGFCVSPIWQVEFCVSILSL